MKLQKPFTRQAYLDFYTYAQLNQYKIIENDTCFELVKIQPSSLSNEDIRQKRFDLYVQFIDPITAQIQRLRDEEQTQDLQNKILALQEERSAKIKDIKEKYPYNKD